MPKLNNAAARVYKETFTFPRPVCSADCCTIFCFSIHPRDKQDVAYRLTLGARAVAYHEKDVRFSGPLPKRILYTQVYIKITYDQPVSVRPSKDIFEVRLVCVRGHCLPRLIFLLMTENTDLHRENIHRTCVHMGSSIS